MVYEKITSTPYSTTQLLLRLNSIRVFPEFTTCTPKSLDAELADVTIVEGVSDRGHYRMSVFTHAWTT
jgi:hypothetical protein